MIYEVPGMPFTDQKQSWLAGFHNILLTLKKSYVASLCRAERLNDGSRVTWPSEKVTEIWKVRISDGCPAVKCAGCESAGS